MSDLDAINAAIRAVERDAELLRLMRDWRQSFHAELAELRDDMLALSNRIEAVTRATTSTDFPGLPRGRGDTITIVPE